MNILISLIIIAVIVGAICYIVSLVPFIPDFLKRIIYVVAGVGFTIAALQKLLVLF